MMLLPTYEYYHIIYIGILYLIFWCDGHHLMMPKGVITFTSDISYLASSIVFTLVVTESYCFASGSLKSHLYNKIYYLYSRLLCDLDGSGIHTEPQGWETDIYIAYDRMTAMATASLYICITGIVVVY